MSLLSARRDKNWIACIDFGTALSKVAMVRAIDRTQLRPDDIRPLALSVRQNYSPYLLPSIVFVTETHLLFGHEAAEAATRAEGTNHHAFASPKQHLSTHDSEDLEGRLPADIDPTGRFSARDLLRLYMAHLLYRAGNDAKERDLPWPVPLRVARPAWERQRAEHGERTLKELVRDGFALVDKLAEKLSEGGGVRHEVALKAVRSLAKMTREEERLLFKLSDGIASVLEATAVAAGTIRHTGRRVVAIADVGAGTSDFGAFMTGLPGRNVLAELTGSSRVLREAGDFLDMQLRRFVLTAAGLLADDPAARGISNRLRVRARANKELLFSEGKLTVEVGDDLLEVSLGEFLADAHVAGFAERLRKEFHETLVVAVQCAESHSPPGGQVAVEILLTGGGHTLPMVRALLGAPSVRWLYTDGAPDLVERPEDLAFHSARRQLVVAIGGAMRDLPKQTAPVRNRLPLWLTPGR